MCLKLSSILILALVKGVTLEESGENGFVVVSTTERSTQQLDEQPEKFENRSTNNSHQLEVIELQFQQIQKSLEDIKLTNQCPNQTIQEIFDSNKKIQKMLEDMDLIKRQQLENAPFRNCHDVKERGNNVSRVYSIQPQISSNPFNVWCDMETRGGGWTYILNRYDGSQNFDLNWTDYKNGFGDPAKEVWLGLEHQHQLTASENNELLIELVDFDDKKAYARYKGFKIGNETEGYPIEVLQGYSGNAGDSFSRHSGMKFTTKDKDQDTTVHNCASGGWGGWWYHGGCMEGKLTGAYKRENYYSMGTIYWKTFRDISLKGAKMMVRPKRLKKC